MSTKEDITRIKEKIAHLQSIYYTKLAEFNDPTTDKHQCYALEEEMDEIQDDIMYLEDDITDLEAKMPTVVCNNCGWEGTEEDLVTLNESNRHNPQDKSLYFFKACPECRTDDYLMDIE